MIRVKEQKALLAGATGLVGDYCLQYLLADSAFSQVTVLTRGPLEQNHPKLQEVIVDFDHLADYTSALQADVIFCCLGTTLKKAGSREAFARVDHDYVVELARMSADRGARSWLHVSAVAADARSAIFYNRVKGRTEEAVKALPFRTVHIMRPSLLLGSHRESRPAEALGQRIMPLFSGLLQGSLAKYRPIPAKMVARRMVELAKTEQSGVYIHHFQM